MFDHRQSTPFTTALFGGALAGTAVDLSLFPLDTLKTRLQSAQGFASSGGFTGIYRGVGSALVGSAPGAALFFVSYEGCKSYLSRCRHRVSTSKSALAIDHMIAASAGEVAACMFRVPTEVVKQRAQAGQASGSSARVLRAIWADRHTRGLVHVTRELYRGWTVTVLREVPFTVIQFPLWEALKSWTARRRERLGCGLFGRREAVGPQGVSAPESAVLGSLAGAVAAGITTPLDVLKTRVILSKQSESAWRIAGGVLKEHGVTPFFAGIGPRVTWISVGGAIFLGTYQWMVNILDRAAL